MGYTCATCGEYHDELPRCFLVPMPAVVALLSEDERRKRVEQSSDQCVLDGEHFFVLGNLDLPIHGADAALRWTVWTTLSEKNFERASELWHTEGRESEPPYCGWLSNAIPGYASTVGIKTLVHTEQVGVRPRIEVVADDHPLAQDQRTGISTARADELIHAALRSDAG